jgi:hypothetical protein
MLGSGANPKRKWIFYLFTIVAVAMGASIAHAQSSPVDCSGYITVTTANERSTLDRLTRETTSTADVTLTNSPTSGKTLLAPFRAIINIKNPTGTVKMPEALVSSDSGKFYYDLSSKLKNGTLLPGASISFSVKFVRASTVRFTYTISTYAVPSAANQPPVANAGPNQTLTLSAGQNSINVQLDGSASYDLDGTIKTYTWSGAPDPADIINPTVTLAQGTHAFSLVVADNNGATSPASTVTIIINPAPNQAPVAHAGANSTFTLPWGQTSMRVTLDGSGSHDPDGSITAYSWSGAPPPGSEMKPSVMLSAGTYEFGLVVTDNSGATSAPASVRITILASAAIHPPEITLSSPPYRIAAGSSTPLTITVNSTSPDGRSVALSASPQLSNALFSTVPGVTAGGTFTFKPQFAQAGVFLVTFTARDTLGLTRIATAHIDVSSANRPPVLTLQETATVIEGGVLTIPVTAIDPDGDILTLSAEGLPEHAVFAPSAGSITFVPDFTQAGTYPVTVKANDGIAEVTKTVSITVTDAPGGGNEPGQLTLQVDPVESPTFLNTQRITGSVNRSTGGSQPRQTSALITGMSPTAGAQGATVTVELTGNSGDYAPHFNQGTSAANFGDGIKVTSLTVTNSTQATAKIEVDPSATIGTRSVRIATGSETAVSLNAFSVTAGKTSVSGRLIDPDTGLAIAGASVFIQGTTLTAITDENGNFVIQGVPAGQQSLMINAADHAVVTVPFTSQPNTNVNLDVLKTQSIVFDPSAPPSVSLISVVGRNACKFPPKIDREKVRKTVIDSLILVGEDVIGIVDDYGNQLNPGLKEANYITLNTKGIDSIVDDIERGESVALHEILFSLNFGLEWADHSGHSTQPLSLAEWIHDLQTMVNKAWANPYDADSALPVLVFNREAILTAEPPVISPYTRLNPLQAFVLQASMWAFILED